MVTRDYLILMVALLFSEISLAVEEIKTEPEVAIPSVVEGGVIAPGLYDKGLEIGFTHKSDFMSNTSGGLKRGTVWMGHTEIRIKMDMEKLSGWNSSTAYFHFQGESGSKFNRDYVGSFVGVDNLETGVNTAQFFHAWMQKSDSSNSLSVLFGLYPIDYEFYVTDTSSVFIQPPYGMANDLGQPVLGANQAPAIFPTGALTVRIKYILPSKNYYMQYALADGIPGDPGNQYGTHVLLNKGDGTLSIAEWGYMPQNTLPLFGSFEYPDQNKSEVKEESEIFNKTALGFWHYSARLQDPVDTGALRSNQGLYFLTERTLRQEKNHPSQGLAGFLRLGCANSELHQADWTGSVGLRYHGLLDGHPDDITGLAVTYNHSSDKYRQLTVGVSSSQTQIELTYRAQVKSWFSLQPTLQYIINPNMNPALNNSWILGTRAEVNF